MRYGRDDNSLGDSEAGMSASEHHYYVYLMASRTRVLYCGITNDLQRRVTEHKSGEFPRLSQKYRCHRLVWFERFQYVGNAIDREKQIKN
jgi:putative endonuclease